MTSTTYYPDVESWSRQVLQPSTLLLRRTQTSSSTSSSGTGMGIRSSSHNSDASPIMTSNTHSSSWSYQHSSVALQNQLNRSASWAASKLSQDEFHSHPMIASRNSESDDAGKAYAAAAVAAIAHVTAMSDDDFRSARFRSSYSDGDQSGKKCAHSPNSKYKRHHHRHHKQARQDERHRAHADSETLRDRASNRSNSLEKSRSISLALDASNENPDNHVSNGDSDDHSRDEHRNSVYSYDSIEEEESPRAEDVSERLDQERGRSLSSSHSRNNSVHRDCSPRRSPSQETVSHHKEYARTIASTNSSIDLPIASEKLQKTCRKVTPQSQSMFSVTGVLNKSSGSQCRSMRSEMRAEKNTTAKGSSRPSYVSIRPSINNISRDPQLREKDSCGICIIS
ncbi:hypothetical protein V1511DRAFT_487518 [Dipodascopsis uninucleata]